MQRQTYSMHKNRPLIKPMILVTTTGYIVDVFGPYFADSKNNDACIMKTILVRLNLMKIIIYPELFLEHVTIFSAKEKFRFFKKST